MSVNQRTREEWLQHCETVYRFHPGYVDALRISPQERLRASLVLDFVQGHFTPGASLLDAGCQDGWFSAQLQRKGWNVTGIDPVKKWIDWARLRYPAVNFVQGFLEDQKWSEQFDFVLCTETIEHIQEEQFGKFLFSLIEAAKWGAYLFLSVPLPRCGEHPTHAKIWGKREFREEMDRHIEIMETMELDDRWNVVIGTKGVRKEITSEELVQLMGGDRR